MAYKAVVEDPEQWVFADRMSKGAFIEGTVKEVFEHKPNMKVLRIWVDNALYQLLALWNFSTKTQEIMKDNKYYVGKKIRATKTDSVKLSLEVDE